MYHQLDDDRPKDECGVFGIYGHDDAAAITTLGLHALQHRGQESAGIVTFDKNHFQADRRIGLVSEHFTKQSVIDRLSGNTAIGHVVFNYWRYGLRKCNHSLLILQLEVSHSS